MAVLFVIFIFHFLIGQLIEIYKLKPLAVISAVLLLAATYYFTLGLEYTADYYMYRYYFKNDGKTDFLFMRLSDLFRVLRYDFHDLFAFHIIISVLLYYYFISRFTNNIFYVFFAYIMMDYVHYANQIRYFLGFPIMLIAFYNFYRKRYLVFVLCAIFAFLSHSALIVLLLFIPLYLFVSPKKYLRYILTSSFFCFVVVYLAFTLGIGQQIEHFGEYFGESGISSFLGGIFNGIPYLLFAALLYFETIKYKRRNPSWFEDEKFVFLYKLTFFTFLFIPTSFYLQISGHRYVMPFAIIYGIYFLYIIKDLKHKVQFRKMFIYSSVCFVICLAVYLLSSVLFKDSKFLYELEHMFKSIDYLNYTEW